MPEYFETFSADGSPLGLVPRHHVHQQGLWHKSAHVFLFTSDGDLYLQRRAADKDLYANLWDYSVGEHLTPGETYHDAALRGLQEELGVSGITLRSVGAERTSTFILSEHNVADQEFQQAFTGCYDGRICADPVEVSEVRTIGLDELERWIARTPEQFTPFVIRDIFELGFISGTPK
jgi:isopentenyl-diphosphate delta-isomerase